MGCMHAEVYIICCDARRRCIGSTGDAWPSALLPILEAEDQGSFPIQFRSTLSVAGVRVVLPPFPLFVISVCRSACKIQYS